MENLNSMSDTTIINTLFDIAAIEADEYGELTLQDEQDYLMLDWEIYERAGNNGRNIC